MGIAPLHSNTSWAFGTCKLTPDAVPSTEAYFNILNVAFLVTKMALFESSNVLVVIAVALCLAYTVSGALYRLYLSPLARFPGPRLAALTSWYELYHDCLKRGRFTWDVKTMHDQYGPLMPTEPAFWLFLYRSIFNGRH